MINIQDLLNLKNVARSTLPLSGSQWPPSVYYRYLAELVAFQNSRVFVELGTCGGGCSRNVAVRNPTTTVITIDVVKEPQVNLVEKHVSNFKFVQGDSAELAKTIGEKYKGLIDTLFIDTVHEYNHVMKEFNAWKLYLAPNAVVVFDDLNRNSMDKVWADLPGIKTEFNALKEMHISGSPSDGGFGALILR
jgi:predicted O-methyltransferase YrrM